MTPVVIGTGYLGRTLCHRLSLEERTALHTFRSHRYFADSVLFDLFHQNLSDVVDLFGSDTVVVASKVENTAKTAQLAQAIYRLFNQCRDKRVVYVSSDAVFDGKLGMYRETDRPNPATTYGTHKALCEEILQGVEPNYCIVRTSYIYGFSLGQLDDRLSSAKALMGHGRTVRKYDDMFKSPIEVNQLAQILAFVCESEYRGVVHVCGPRISVYEFFSRALQALGCDTHRLLADSVPKDHTPECLVDTSLDNSLLRKLFGVEPVSVTVSLKTAMVESGAYR